MADNTSLGAAKSAKNDEFYTQYSDIEAEMNAYVEYNKDVFRDKTILLPCDDPEWSEFTRYFASNFERFGIKKLISTSYAKGAANAQLSLFEMDSPLYDEYKHAEHGRLYTLTRDTDGSGNIDTDDIEFSGYLEGDGDFRSDEVKKLRDEADIIITNPPFSLFREFLKWILDAKKQFIIVGNINAITYKEVFPFVMKNEIWVGAHFNKTVEFIMPDDYELKGKAYIDKNGKKHGFVPGVSWLTNIDLASRHNEIIMDTAAHNLKFNKRLIKKLKTEYNATDYPVFVNYDAIEVPFTECIPSDYDGNMAVPVTFMGRYVPSQFQIIGASSMIGEATPETIEYDIRRGRKGGKGGAFYVRTGMGPDDYRRVYDRIIIRHKKGQIE